MALKRWDEIYKRIKTIKNPYMAEVGVDNGKLSKQILSMHKGVTLYMIDRWAAPPQGDSYITSGASIPGKNKQYFENTLRNCKVILNHFPGRGIMLRGESVEMAKQCKDDFFDIVFIDADHSYAGCKSDIIVWLPKVKKGGYLSGHDYNHPDQGEVKKAVDEVLGRENIKIGENRTWFYKVR